MITISEEKVNERWDTLPFSLKQALTSEVNSDFVWKTCESEHIPNEKIYFVGRAISHVLLGFIHPGDLAQEIKELTDLNQQIATSIANAVNERVFKPLSADLEKIYEPPSALAPKPVIMEIKPLDATSAFAKASADKQDKPFDATRGRPPAPSRVEAPAPFTPPARRIDEGESRIGISAPPAAPKTEGLKPFEVKTTETSPFSKPIGEIKPPSPSQVLPSKIWEGKEPPPAILHEEPSSTPSKSAQGFKIETPTPKLSEMKLGGLPTRPAVLEFEGAKPLMPPPPNPKPEEKVRIVHYTELRTNLPKTSTAPPPPEPGREIKEITRSSTPFTASELPKLLTPTHTEPPPAPKPFDSAQGKPPAPQVPPKPPIVPKPPMPPNLESRK